MLLGADTEPLLVYSLLPEAVCHRYSQQKWKSKHNLLLTTSVAAQLFPHALWKCTGILVNLREL